MWIAKAPLTSTLKILSNLIINHTIGSSAKLKSPTLVQDFLFFMTCYQIITKQPKSKFSAETPKQMWEWHFKVLKAFYFLVEC